jgi:hypothetical protein
MLTKLSSFYPYHACELQEFREKRGLLLRMADQWAGVKSQKSMHEARYLAHCRFRALGSKQTLTTSVINIGGEVDALPLRTVRLFAHMALLVFSKVGFNGLRSDGPVAKWTYRVKRPVFIFPVREGLMRKIGHTCHRGPPRCASGGRTQLRNLPKVISLKTAIFGNQNPSALG